MQNRKSLRAPGWDYAAPGAYFVTVCTDDHKSLFGTVVRYNDRAEVKLNMFGKIVERELIYSEILRDEIHLDEFVIMPNHLHAIIWITPSDVGVGGADPSGGNSFHVGVSGGNPSQTRGNPSQIRLDPPGDRRSPGVRRTPLLQSKSLGAFVAGFKSVVTSGIRKMTGNRHITIWQRNYYDRVIRNERELRRIRKYIRYNPENWVLDECPY